MDVENRIIEIRGQKVLLDRDVAELYGVETRIVNQAMRNNPDKFPWDYVITLTPEEKKSLRSKFLTLENNGRGQHSKYPPKAFTEKGLYMLATILKSPIATQTTLSIIESFAKLRELSRNIKAIHDETDNTKQKGLIQRTGELLSDLLIDDSEITETESTIELNLMAVKFKHTVKRTKKQEDNNNKS